MFLQILEKQKLKRILLNVDFAKFHGNYDLQITHSDFLFFIFIILTTFESRQDVPVVLWDHTCSKSTIKTVGQHS